MRTVRGDRVGARGNRANCEGCLFTNLCGLCWEVTRQASFFFPRICMGYIAGDRQARFVRTDSFRIVQVSPVQFALRRWILWGEST